MRIKAKLPLVSADIPEKAFWCVDGHIFHNVVEMQRALTEMTDLTFAYHVNKDKNDFLPWIESVVKDHELAKIFKLKKTRTAALRAVQDRLRDYQF